MNTTRQKPSAYSPKHNARRLALSVIHNVVRHGQSTGQSLPLAQAQCPPRDRGLLQQLVMGCLQNWYGLQQELSLYLQKPLKAKDADIQCILTLGLYQLRHTRVPAHAAISETVSLCPKNKSWARGLCNAILRKASTAEAQEQTSSELPPWLHAKLKKDWPKRFEQIAKNSRLAAPLTLRAVRSRQGLLDVLTAAEIDHNEHPFAASAVNLTNGVDITTIEGFDNGDFIVQDAAAQFAAELLAPQDDEYILDACAAPGGKTTHILQLAPNAQVVALDSEAARLERVQENLERLKQNAEIVAADARNTDKWWSGQPFDRILLDAPCSATGVIRRHPDIKLLRRESDIPTLVSLQKEIINALWKTLKPGGRMLYCTCSILKDENQNQIAQFLDTQPDAIEIPLDVDWGQAEKHGRQLFPGDYEMDGFYYCLLEKANSAERGK